MSTKCIQATVATRMPSPSSSLLLHFAHLVGFSWSSFFPLLETQTKTKYKKEILKRTSLVVG